MPFFLTHIYHLKVNNLINQPGALAGNLLPDIRYLLLQKRETTHFNVQLFDKDYDTWGQFRIEAYQIINNNKINIGYAAHLFLDVLWGKHISPLYNNKLEELGVKIALELFLMPKIDKSFYINIDNIFSNQDAHQFSKQSLREWEVFIKKYFDALYDGQDKYFDFLKNQTFIQVLNLDNIFETAKNKAKHSKEIKNILNSVIFKL